MKQFELLEEVVARAARAAFTSVILGTAPAGLSALLLRADEVIQ